MRESGLMKQRLGVVGVGKIGEPIAQNLHQSGFDTLIYARRPEVVQRMADRGIESAKTPRELAERVDIILDILTDTEATWSVLRQDGGLLEGLAPSKIMIDMTTSDPDRTIELAEFLEGRGIQYLDAPITGGVIGARDRNLVLMVGGPEKLFQECRYILETIAKKIFYLGGSGSGHSMKLIHNQLSHSTFLAACEAATLGMKFGLPLKTMIDVFNHGNARSYATEVRFPRFILSERYDAGASFKTVHKDIGIVLEKARKRKLSLPITEATFRYWGAPIEQGREQEDYTTVFRWMEEICRVPEE
jgi:3-hydroxyisobutyrate dehydrogenase-like beta-hydroxyacid dehydrogenase